MVHQNVLGVNLLAFCVCFRFFPLFVCKQLLFWLLFTSHCHVIRRFMTPRVRNNWFSVSICLSSVVQFQISFSFNADACYRNVLIVEFFRSISINNASSACILRVADTG